MREAWTAVGFLWFAFALNYLDRQMIFSMFPLLRRELALTDAELGLVGTVFLWVYSLSMPLAGRVADRMPAHRLVLASLTLWSLATFGTGLSRNLGELLVWRAALGVSEALYYPAAVGLLAHVHSNATRSKALAAHQSAQYLGAVAGGWYGGWAAEYLGLRAGFGWAALVGLVLAGLLGRWLPRPRRQAPAALNGRPLWRNLGHPGYLALALAFFVLCVMLWMFYAWLPTLLYERFQLSMTDTGLIASGYLQVGAVAGVLLGGVWGDRAARDNPQARLILAAAGLLGAAPCAFWSLSETALGGAKLLVLGFGAASGVMVANVFSAIYDLVPAQSYSLAVGLINMLGGISGGAAVLLAGHAKADWGIDTLMRSAAVAAVVAGSLLAWVYRSYCRRSV